MMRLAFGTAVATAALLVAACAMPTSGVVRVGPDSYKLSRADPGGRYADAAAMKAAVVADADAFARRQGKVAVPVETHEETMRVGHLSTIDYVFRLAPPGENTTARVEPAPPGENTTARVEPAPPVAAATEPVELKRVEQPQSARTGLRQDLYADLVKLDELRKRGILTEAEFQMLKTRLLAEH